MSKVQHLAHALICASFFATTSVALAEKYVVDLSSAPKDFAMRAQSAVSGSSVMALDISPAEAARLEAQGVVIEPNVRWRIQGHVVQGRAGLAASGWAAAAMDIPKAHKLANARGAGQKVCVVDTGVDKSHSYLKGKVIASLSRVPSGKTADDNGHGTHVASLIAGSSELGSPAPEAKIISVKAMEEDGVGDTDWIAKAIDDCVKQKANVINMSLGASTGSSVLRRAIQRARSAGVTVVASSGNDGGRLNYPAAYSETIAVGATNRSNRVSSFSSRGSGLDFVAPGESIVGARAGGGTVTMSGTSMAAPFVAGMVALKNSRKSNGIETKSLGLPSSVQGKGLVNANDTALNR